MELSGSTIAVADHLPSEAVSPFDLLKQSARLEFQAAMQLLAERAAFLTAAGGIGIAVIEEGKFVYCVAAGDDVPASGSVAECIPSASDGMRIVVPFKSGEEVVSGFFELVSKGKFSADDSQQIGRLAELAGIAAEHLEAAERAGLETWDERQASLAPIEWHAPEKIIQLSGPAEPQPEKTSTGVKSCTVCGFPVSPGRVLCVECELKSDAPVVASGELFSLPHQESWINEHGYTVASIIVSALAIAFIFWLRR